MTTVAAYPHGIHPRSEAVVAATRDLDRGRTTREEVDARFQDDLENLVALQREAGLDYLSDGMLRWQDLFRPLADEAQGMRAAHLVRWFDNNAFFRAPHIEDGTTLEGAPPILSGTLGSVPRPRVACLPSPYVFSRAAATSGDRDDLMARLATDVLRPVVDDLAARGLDLLHLEEPWLGFHGIDAASWDPFERALGTLTDGLDIPTVLHVYLGDASRFGDRLGKLPVDAVGIDAVATELDNLSGGWSTGLLVGCLDGRNTPLEPADKTAEVVARLAESLEPPTVYVSTNSELGLLPSGPAADKIRRLGEIAALLKERLA